MFIYGLDISLGSYGWAIADEDYNIKRIGTIKTKSIMSTPNRLDMIWDVLLQLKVKYPPKLVLIEQGFTKFNKSTQQIFRVHGITNLAFKNIEQITYTPLTLKKAVCDTSKAKKEDIMKKVKELYPELNIKTSDEADAIALIYYYQNYIERKL